MCMKSKHEMIKVKCKIYVRCKMHIVAGKDSPENVLYFNLLQKSLHTGWMDVFFFLFHFFFIIIFISVIFDNFVFCEAL